MAKYNEWNSDIFDGNASNFVIEVYYARFFDRLKDFDLLLHYQIPEKMEVRLFPGKLDTWKLGSS